MSEVTGSKNRNSLLNAALEKGDDFYKRVEIDGRVYCVFKSQGNDILRLGSTDTQKAAAVGKICIDAIKAKTEQDHIDSGVRELNATGLDFEDGHHQGTEGATLSSDQADVLLEELTSSQSKLDGLYNQIKSSSDTEFPKENINQALRSFLVQPPKAKYTKDEVLDAIKGCAKHQVRLARDTVFGDKSKEKETEFNAIFIQDKSIKGLIDDSKALLKDSMTAETAWKVMEAIFSSTQYHVALDPTVTIISSTNSTTTDTINTDPLSSPVRTGMDLLDQVVDGATKSLETTDRDSSIVLPYVSRQELQNMIEDPRVEQPKKRTWGDTARDAWSWVPTPKFWNWKSQGLWGSSATTTQKQFEHPKERGSSSKVLSPNIVPITDYALNSKETDRERSIQYATNPPPFIHNRHGQKLIPSTSLSKGYVGQLKLIGQTDSSKTLDKAAKQKAASSALVKIQKEETQFDENEKIVIKDAIEHVPDDYRSVDPDAFIHAGIVRHLKRLESMT